MAETTTSVLILKPIGCVARLKTETATLFLLTCNLHAGIWGCDMAFDQVMKDKIKIALQDKRNGTLQTIYQRIHKYGTPFKTFDKRYKYGTEPTLVAKDGLSRQLIRYRIKHGWNIDKAKNYVKERIDE